MLNVALSIFRMDRDENFRIYRHGHFLQVFKIAVAAAMDFRKFAAQFLPKRFILLKMLWIVFLCQIPGPHRVNDSGGIELQLFNRS